LIIYIVFYQYNLIRFW